jgi:hypothetical protein
MFQLLTRISSGELFKVQLPVLLAALVVAELFYKLGSFTLECLAFLATWFVFDAVTSTVRKRIGIG